MSYICDKCEYSTYNKSNYNKHLKSKIHSINTVNKSTNTNVNITSKRHLCPNCHKTYSSAPSLSRHKNKFCNKQKLESNDNVIILTQSQLDDKLRIKELETENKLLNKYINSDKINKNVNITVIKYAQENYPNAPVLSKMNDYSSLENNETELLGSLIKYHKDNQLHKYLGDFIIKYYKKENHKDQSLWNTDVSRLSYVIKELIANEKSGWTKDKEGLKTKECIIEPMLLYIKNVIKNNIDKYSEVDHNKYDDMVNRFQDGYVLIAIKQLICNDQLAYKIIKYITPYFYMDKPTNLIEN